MATTLVGCGASGQGKVAPRMAALNGSSVTPTSGAAVTISDAAVTGVTIKAY